MNPSFATRQQDARTIRRLRRCIGILGMALPFIVTIGNSIITGKPALLNSISSSYYTHMRDVFVGGICAIGVFLISYRPDRADDYVSNLAGVLAVSVAIFPTLPDRHTAVITETDRTVAVIHMVSAAALFLLLAYFCLFVFTRSDHPKTALPARKRLRNTVYRTCGALIMAALALLVASHWLPASINDAVKPLFWGETVAILAFGVAWLVKGETIFKDQPITAVSCPTSAGNDC